MRASRAYAGPGAVLGARARGAVGVRFVIPPPPAGRVTGE